ncbi:hypothetical protein CN918_29425 [Priestia megaterium]|nr:hypothetical protein CN918_29425 [Priestia megaterium]
MKPYFTIDCNVGGCTNTMHVSLKRNYNEYLDITMSINKSGKFKAEKIRPDVAVVTCNECQNKSTICI